MSSTMPGSPPPSAATREVALAEEVTILWQTDEVRSQRPRVVDEIRQALWFLEDSLWDAAADLLAAWRDHLPGSPLRFGTWIGGDLDGNPNAGAETVREAVERGSALVRELLRRDVRALAASWGMSSTLVDADNEVAAVDAARGAQPDGAVPAPAHGDLGASRGRRVRVGRRPACGARPRRGEPPRSRRIADRGRRARRAPTPPRPVRPHGAGARPPHPRPSAA